MPHIELGMGNFPALMQPLYLCVGQFPAQTMKTVQVQICTEEIFCRKSFVGSMFPTQYTCEAKQPKPTSIFSRKCSCTFVRRMFPAHAGNMHHTRINI